MFQVNSHRILLFIMASDPSHIICMGLLSLTLFKQHLVFVTNQNKQQVLPMRKGGRCGWGYYETFIAGKRKKERKRTT